MILRYVMSLNETTHTRCSDFVVVCPPTSALETKPGQMPNYEAKVLSNLSCVGIYYLIFIS